MLEDLPLDPAVHDRQAFKCGVPALDEYLQRFAQQHRQRGISSIYVLTDSAQPEHILGYYTLSAAEVDAQLGQLAQQLLGRQLPPSPDGES